MTSAHETTLILGGSWHGQYGTAPCPVCQPERRNNQNALTLANGDDGKLLLHCKKAQCSFTDILAASGVAQGSYDKPDLAATARRASEAKEAAAQKVRQALRCWEESRSIKGSFAGYYLREIRGIACRLPETLRFNPSCWHGPTGRRYPALVASVCGGDAFAVHRTYLRPGGTGKAGLAGGDKLMLGRTRGGAVRLTDGAGPLVIGEGIESTLSAFLLHGVPTARAWAALSTSGLRGLRLPTASPSGLAETHGPSLILAIDGDAAGRAAGRDLAQRATGLGWHVGIMDPGDGIDWNDRLMMEVRRENA
ncbi:DUF7146 domain-containing protein [Roseovarius sp. ZX-A-9]|uniref:DUF7146 domain-containing protein n=1 Tax=Roseovarius sp. ZX-A-9 TaxID=3014783 RepID=UPI002330708F|nr:toprim domain-containing protein [Roseovarius sp. ZX-A-9]